MTLRTTAAPLSQIDNNSNGFIFQDEEGGQLVYWECREAGYINEHTHDVDEYFTVIKGSFTLMIGPDHLTFEAGEECWIPAKLPHAANFKSDTLTLHAFGRHQDES